MGVLFEIIQQIFNQTPVLLPSNGLYHNRNIKSAAQSGAIYAHLPFYKGIPSIYLEKA